MSHGDRVDAQMPAGLQAIAGSTPRRADRRHGRRNAPLLRACSSIPEVTHTTPGHAHLFSASCARSAAAAVGLESWQHHPRRSSARVRAQVGKGRVLLGLSGGVDSSVVAALLHKAIGDQLVCVFVDHGLLRHGRRRPGDADLRREPRRACDPRQCRAALSFGELKGVADPEAKRKIIGRLFVEVFDEEARARQESTRRGFPRARHDLPGCDRVRRQPRPARRIVIKSHHNVGGLPAHMKHEAGRAAARAVQGRSAPPSASSSACRARWSTATRSRAPASASASSAK